MSVTINELIIGELSQLAKTEGSSGNRFKSTAYRNAIKTIKNLSTQISSGKEAMGYAGIGKSIGLKIDEIIKNQTLLRNQVDKKNVRVQALEFLTSVHGIGPKRAATLYDNHNIRDLKSLQKHRDLLTGQQIIGLDLYSDLQKKIERSEMDLIIKVLNCFLPRKIKMTVCGSYRRGLLESSDIDVLLTKENWVSGEDIPKDIPKFITKLKDEGFLTHELAYGTKKYMGVCRLNSELLETIQEYPEDLVIGDDYFYHRRIDIRFIPYNNYFCGVLYFTGSGEFNVMMRKKALAQGFSINEYKVTDQNDESAEFLINSEKDIFDLIEMEYVEPKNRK